jgi:hypothetical protein
MAGLRSAVHPPAVVNMVLPSLIDPRGMLAYGLAGTGLFLFFWFMKKNRFFLRDVSILGYISAYR